MLVAVHHFFLFTVNAYHFNLIESFFLFVDFFFVLSGFVIALNYQDRINSSRDVFIFIVRRFGRVWPAHAVVMFGFALFISLLIVLDQPSPYTVGATPTTYDPRKFPLVLALTNSFGFYSGGWNLPSWSISAEFFSYALFSLIFLSTMRKQLALLFVVVALATIIAVSKDYINLTAQFGAIRCVFGFGVGVLTYSLYRVLQSSRALVDFVRKLWIEPLAILLATMFLFNSVRGVGESSSLSLAAPIVFAALVLIFSEEAGPFSALLRLAPMRLLGKLSYSIYINHWLIFLVLAALHHAAVPSYVEVERWGGTYLLWNLLSAYQFWPFLFLFLGTLLLVSYMTFHWIEDPFRIAFNRMASSMKRREQDAV